MGNFECDSQTVKHRKKNRFNTFAHLIFNQLGVVRRVEQLREYLLQIFIPNIEDMVTARLIVACTRFLAVDVQ